MVHRPSIDLHFVIPSTLARQVRRHATLLVAFSGGVDSAVVAVVARRLLGRRRMLAALAVSPSLSRVQHDLVGHIARTFDLPLREVQTDEVADPGYAANTPGRCYFCKRKLWTSLTDLAHRWGLSAVADGTNADDVSDHRPGARAAQEYAVVSPLLEAGMTKDDVRELARALGLPNWHAPASPCLASRIRYGIEVTPARLLQVERAEAVLRGAGIAGDLRVRHRGDEARIEVAPDQFSLVRSRRDAVVRGLRAAGFRRITLDLAGYRRGSFLRRDAAVEDLTVAESA